MVKIYTHTEEIECCGECANCDLCSTVLEDCCLETGRAIEDMWGEIPSWCPLEEKK